MNWDWGEDAVRFFYFRQREGGSELKYYVKQLKNCYKLVYYLLYSVLHNFFWEELIYALSYFSRIQQVIICLLVSVLVVSSLIERCLFLLKHLFLLRKFLVSLYKWFFFFKDLFVVLPNLYKKETSQLICPAKQWTGFYMIGTFVV